jgi:F420-non-reducing hydrogenase iron-sulfur subunit
MRRVAMLRMLLKANGIDARRLRVEWVSAAEGEKWARVVNEMTEEIRTLGPLQRVAATAGAAAD